MVIAMYILKMVKLIQMTLLEDWVRIVEDNGAGEILLNAIDRDGMMNGYDLGTIKKIQKLVSIPIIACGGAGSIMDFGKLIRKY
jgi:cyclase